MNRQKKMFKKILLRIANLSRKDRHWILKNLSPTQQQIFQDLNSEQLLIEATRYIGMNPNTKSTPTPLPIFCQTLAKQPTLYIAIILEQGSYKWQGQFIKNFDTYGLIKKELDKNIATIKLDTKKLLFNQWEKSLSFDSYLRTESG